MSQNYFNLRHDFRLLYINKSLHTLYEKAMPGITDMAFHFNYEEIFALQFYYDYPPPGCSR